MKLWCEIMFSCYIPFRTTWAEWDEYDVDDTPPPPLLVERIPTEPDATVDSQTRPPDLRLPSSIHFSPVNQVSRKKNPQETETRLKAISVGKQKHFCVMHYQSAVSWGFPNR